MNWIKIERNCTYKSKIICLIFRRIVTRTLYSCSFGVCDPIKTMKNVTLFELQKPILAPHNFSSKKTCVLQNVLPLLIAFFSKRSPRPRPRPPRPLWLPRPLTPPRFLFGVVTSTKFKTVDTKNCFQDTWLGHGNCKIRK